MTRYISRQGCLSFAIVLVMLLVLLLVIGKKERVGLCEQARQLVGGRVALVFSVRGCVIILQNGEVYRDD